MGTVMQLMTVCDGQSDIQTMPRYTLIAELVAPFTKEISCGYFV